MIISRCAVGVLAAVLAACHSAWGAMPASQPTTRATASTKPTTGPVAAVWYEPSGMRIPPPGEKFEPHRLIVGVWRDGTIVWSDDRATGGKPYRKGRVDAPVLARLEQSLTSAGLFERVRENNYGPDASTTVLAAEVGDQRRRLATWHEPARRNPLLVIDQRGIYAIQPGERTPEPSPEYAHFLKVWSESRRLIESVVPTEGEAVTTFDESIFKLGRARR